MFIASLYYKQITTHVQCNNILLEKLRLKSRLQEQVLFHMFQLDKFYLQERFFFLSSFWKADILV